MTKAAKALLQKSIPGFFGFLSPSGAARSLFVLGCPANDLSHRSPGLLDANVCRYGKTGSLLPIRGRIEQPWQQQWPTRERGDHNPNLLPIWRLLELLKQKGAEKHVLQ